MGVSKSTHLSFSLKLDQNANFIKTKFISFSRKSIFVIYFIFKPLSIFYIKSYIIYKYYIKL